MIVITITNNSWLVEYRDSMTGFIKKIVKELRVEELYV
jgi:hypothetical protein